MAVLVAVLAVDTAVPQVGVPAAGRKTHGRDVRERLRGAGAGERARARLQTAPHAPPSRGTRATSGRPCPRVYTDIGT